MLQRVLLYSFRLPHRFEGGGGFFCWYLLCHSYLACFLFKLFGFI